MVHALPGMGGDARMFPGVWKSLPEFLPHDWTPYRGERSIADVARAVKELYGIRDGDSLVGASLGGIVACEIARQCDIRHIFLVGSATRPDEIHRLLARIRPLADVAPFGLMRTLARGLPGELMRMFSGSSPEFVRAMCRAVFDWPGFDGPGPRIYRIHGRRDVVITPPAAADLFVDGGHLISMTHAAECAEFVRSVLVAPAAQGTSRQNRP
ncbi:MAG: hypothetical protein JNL97_14515 [Verrucomicrobiales bacterium]|nr:hypothetical protein [Verrucomicrobiales bacterium]